MSPSYRVLFLLAGLTLMAMSCQILSQLTPTQAPATATPLPPTLTPTSLPPIPVQPGEENPDEPVFISGAIHYTSPFFVNSLAEPMVLLEDQAGFAKRDEEFTFNLAGQVIGPVQVHEGQILTYQLALPAIPQGTLLDLDNDNETDTGVQVFALAYWANTWGGPFLEEREGHGWSTAYASTRTDPEQDHEVIGGTLVVWAPNAEQAFPTAFGPDGLLFTEDDPTAPIPAGYSLVNLDQQPFRVYKEARPQIDLNEGTVAVNDFSQMSYAEAFEALFEKVSREYPFTAEKGIDWQALHAEFAPRFESAKDAEDFYRAIRDFTWKFPDAHVGMGSEGFNADIFYEEQGGSLGLILAELSDGRILVTEVIPGTVADQEGIQPGAEILTWQGEPAGEAISKIVPYFGLQSTPHHRRLEQLTFLTRLPPGTRVELAYQNPGGARKEVTLRADVEYDSLLKAISPPDEDELGLPVESEVLDESGLGYIRVGTFSDDYNLMARLWEHAIKGLNENEVPGLILDLRSNGGGSIGMALNFSGYFFDQEMDLYQSSYYSDLSGKFEMGDEPVRIKPAPIQYQGKVTVLVGPNCVSACEGFAYAMQQEQRATIVGHFPTAGAFGEVGRGQYKLPEGITLQFPTGRPETLDGKLLIEGTGVVPDITVPVTEESVLQQTDTVLQAAIEALLQDIP